MSREWIKVASAAHIEQEEMVQIKVDERHILVYAREEGGFCATDGLCTHEQASLIEGYLDGEVIECPKHNARFHICSGKALKRPAKQDLATYPVKVEGGEVFVEVELA